VTGITRLQSLHCCLPYGNFFTKVSDFSGVITAKYLPKFYTNYTSNSKQNTKLFIEFHLSQHHILQFKKTFANLNGRMC
jgi:hypothetical protein